jgi:periplasmic divalent cation tolerance protein
MTDAIIVLVTAPTADKAAELARTLVEEGLAVHPYECPEVPRLDVADGHAPYLKWIGDNVR